MPSYVLVTGGAGYIGSHACRLLLKKGFIPIAYDNLSQGHAAAVQWGPLVVGDILDHDQLAKTLQKYQPVAVMHFAANALVGESVAHPDKYYTNNVTGTISLLNALRTYGPLKLIFSSSCATYGIPQQLPLTEKHPQTPINPYGRSKFFCEQIIQDYAAAYGLSFAILRYFNAAGASIDSLIGEDHTPETHLVPLLLQTALGQRDFLEVYGQDFKTKDGSCIRDYIHVADLAEAHFLALQWLLGNKTSLALNLGCGQGFSVFEMIAAAKEYCQKAIPLQLKPRRAGDPPVLVADSALAQKTLKWQPKYSTPQQIIQTAWQWHQKQPLRKSI